MNRVKFFEDEFKDKIARSQHYKVYLKQLFFQANFSIHLEVTGMFYNWSPNVIEAKHQMYVGLPGLYCRRYNWPIVIGFNIPCIHPQAHHIILMPTTNSNFLTHPQFSSAKGEEILLRLESSGTKQGCKA